jgi:hypothetical protein
VTSSLATYVLALVGVFFVALGAQAALHWLRFLRLRTSAILTWPPRPPRHRAVVRLVVLGMTMLAFVKLVVERRPPTDAFAEIAVLVFYLGLEPLARRVRYGFYEQGIWLDDGFLRYSEIGGLTWRDADELMLLAVPRMKQMARRLVVPRRHYAEARRLLHDRISSHEIHYGGALDLGVHDERDDV